MSPSNIKSRLSVRRRFDLVRRAVTFGVTSAVALTLSTARALAGGGPENVFLLVNVNSESSKTVANHYIALRQIPATNVLYVDWKGNLEICSGKNFRQFILQPAIKAIEDRRLASQIDYIVYSTDFPWRVELKPLFPEEKFPIPFQPIGSVTGVTYLYSYIAGEKPNPGIVMPSVNWYVPKPNERHLTTCEDIAGVPSRAFRYRYAWNSSGQRTQEEGVGQRYFLSTSLGITQGRGNTVGEVISYLTRAKAADGTRPRGTIYFMRNGNIRSQVRHNCYADAAATITALGVQARVLEGKIPRGAKDVMGIMAGAETFDVAASQNKILPGAICEHLTSAGGIMSSNGYQTPLSEFLRAGAAGASGTVVEPRALQAKFPLPTLQLHYARGCSLAEAFYQSVAGPYQLLIVGDPLCQPWAVPPVVTVEGLKPNQEVHGDVEIKPGGTAPLGRQLGIFEVLVDGRLVARCQPGQSLTFNASKLLDGYHELRIVGANLDAIETQGRIVVPFTVKKDAPALAFEVQSTGDVAALAEIRVSARQTGATAIAIRQNSREIGRIEGEGGEIAIAAAVLGRGPTTLQAISEGPTPTISKPFSIQLR